MKDLKNFNTELPEELIAQLREHSRKSGIYMRKLIELAVIAYLKKTKK